LQQIKHDLPVYKNTGMSVLEMSHRGQDFIQIYQDCESNLRKVLSIPDNFKLLFLSGGASLQFAGVPLNLLRKHQRCGYLITGQWSEKAAAEARKYCDKVEILYDARMMTDNGKYGELPSEPIKIQGDYDYIHYCDNETVNGVEFPRVPEFPSEIPLVCDMSSNIMTRTIDWSKFGVVYAGAQKNLGPAGVTLVVIREDLVAPAANVCPTYMSWQTQLKAAGMYNTPCTFGIYALGVVMEHVLNNGGFASAVEQTANKTTALLQAIDHSGGFFQTVVPRKNQSRVNVPFIIRVDRPDLDQTARQEIESQLESTFLKKAAAVGLVQLAGHRSVGGLRASLYNGVQVEGVHLLAGFMREFQQEHQKSQ
jgi:phosphoserine aminotransferase